MKDRSEIRIGDAVEIRVEYKDRHSKHPTVKWLPATVVFVNVMQIGVALANSERLAIPLHKTDAWRPAKKRQIETKWGTFTLEAMQELKRCHDEAKAAGEDQFTFQNTLWLTAFVGFLIEYAVMEGMEL